MLTFLKCLCLAIREGSILHLLFLNTPLVWRGGRLDTDGGGGQSRLVEGMVVEG